MHKRDRRFSQAKASPPDSFQLQPIRVVARVKPKPSTYQLMNKMQDQRPETQNQASREA